MNILLLPFDKGVDYMSCLYITEQGSIIRAEKGKFIVECKKDILRTIPDETLESIVIFGNTQLSTAAIQKCLEKGIKVSFLSTKGLYFGRLESTGFVNAARLKKQIYLSDNMQQVVEFARKTLEAKVHNQRVILRRYLRSQSNFLEKEIGQLKIYQEKIKQGKTLQEISGYEGIAARTYFQGLSKLVDDSFKFKGRSKQPPKDAFNALLSLGYTLIFYEIYAEVENRSLSPYVGFVHQIKEHHPALISDLLEEWRAVLVDSTIMSLVQGHEISIDEFSVNEKTGGVIISESGVRKLVRKLENKMRTTTHYLDYLELPVTFRRAIWWQVKSLAHCIDDELLAEYHPLRIR